MKTFRKIWLTLPAALLVVLGYGAGSAWQQEAGLDSTDFASAAVRVITPKEVKIDNITLQDDELFYMPCTSIENDTLYVSDYSQVKKVNLKTGKVLVDQTITNLMKYGRVNTWAPFLSFRNNYYYFLFGNSIFKVNRMGEYVREYRLIQYAEYYTVTSDGHVLAADRLGYYAFDSSGKRTDFLYHPEVLDRYGAATNAGIIQDEVEYRLTTGGKITTDSIPFKGTAQWAITKLAEDSQCFSVDYFDRNQSCPKRVNKGGWGFQPQGVCLVTTLYIPPTHAQYQSFRPDNQ